MRLRWPILGGVLAGGALALLPSCGVRYVASSAYYQLELLGSREKVDHVLAEGRLPPEEAARLRLVPAMKAYGKRLGLASTDNYDTYALGWDRTIWNVSACDPLAFEPVTWWFPIVGRVPYLGFFREEDALAWETRLGAEGHDVYRRTAGAYSTLGWFRDPVLPGMLRWSEAALAETVFHELAHATLWVPGSVPFNESFASFVGEQANYRYLADTYGPHSAELREVLTADSDGAIFEGILHDLYGDLDAAFGDPTLSDDARLARKAALYASLPARVSASSIVDQARYLANANRSPWNNARLMQFRFYNANEAWFLALLEREGGDLPAFIEAIRSLTRGARDPFGALRLAAGDAVQNP